jgi:hypothetical protein
MADTTNTAEQAIKDQLRRLEWMIPDAKRRMDEAAQCMLRRAQNAVKATEAMLADGAWSLSWVDFAESDLRAAREAKAELMKLYEQQNMLKFFLGKD